VYKRQGDRQAFEAIALQSHTRLQALALGIRRDSHLAEDAVQQALLDMWRDIPGLRDPGRFDAWSYRVLVRICHAEAKRAPRWLPTPDEVAADTYGADAYGGVIVRDQLEWAFARLPLEQRTVVVLHYLMDLPLDRVAEVLEIPAGTVYSRLSRDMDTLRAAIEADLRPVPSGSAISEVER
jgi:RNA polymerase sigma-70 factor (ECF subfamily)